MNDSAAPGGDRTPGSSPGGPAKLAGDALNEATRRADQARRLAGRGLGELGGRLEQAGVETAHRLAPHVERAAAAIGHKPKLRGVSHQWAFFVFLVAGLILVIAASSGEPRIAAAVYAFSVAGLFGVSALYHRHEWRSPQSRAWMRRLDHTMIFVLIAGTYTPFALLALDNSIGTTILIVIWGCALGGVVLNLIWVDAPKWVSAVVYVGTGWVAVAAMPDLVDAVGWTAVGMIIAGGVLYSAGAVVYATRKPDPRPAFFGYHEIFHLLVIVAAAVHFAAVAAYALPAG